MSQVTSIFITVTATVTGSAVPTMNSTQLHELDVSKQTGQIVALVVLGLFVFLALMLLLCWGILCIRRPKPEPMSENPDVVRHGRGAFLPIIGRGKRKSNAGLEAASGGASEGANSRSSLIKHNVAPRGRRLSMWADEAGTSTDPIPSPPILPMHSRSTSSTDSVGLHGEDNHRSISNASSVSRYSVVPQEHHGYVPQYHDNRSGMESIPLDGPSTMPPAIPPKIGRIDRTSPQYEHLNYDLEDRRVSPIVSPIEDVRGGIRYPQHSHFNEPYNNGMYA